MLFLRIDFRQVPFFKSILKIFVYPKISIKYIFFRKNLQQAYFLQNIFSFIIKITFIAKITIQKILSGPEKSSYKPGNP